MQMETIEIDLTTPIPKQSIVVTQKNVVSAADHFTPSQVIQPAIRSIIKTKKTPMGPHRNAYHGYFYVEEHPPPPPPHAYELPNYQRFLENCYPTPTPYPTPNVQPATLTYDVVDNAPVPLPRNFEMVPYAEPQVCEIFHKLRDLKLEKIQIFLLRRKLWSQL